MKIERINKLTNRKRQFYVRSIIVRGKTKTGDDTGMTDYLYKTYLFTYLYSDPQSTYNPYLSFLKSVSITETHKMLKNDLLVSYTFTISFYLLLFYLFVFVGCLVSLSFCFV